MRLIGKFILPELIIATSIQEALSQPDRKPNIIFILTNDQGSTSITSENRTRPSAWERIN